MGDARTGSHIKGVIWRHGVGARSAHLNAQDFTQGRSQVLCRLERVTAAAPIAHAHVEQVVGAKENRAAVMVLVGLVDGEDALFVGGIGQVGVGRRDTIACQHVVVAHRG